MRRPLQSESSQLQSSTFDSLAYNLRIGVMGKRDFSSVTDSDLRTSVESLLRCIDHVLGEASLYPRAPAGTPPLRRHWCWERLRDALRLVWRDVPVVLVETPPNQRTLVRWTVVSALAKGADRLVADVVLKHSVSTQTNNDASTTNVGILLPRLHAILPMPVDEYRQDCEGAANDPSSDLAEFNRFWEENSFVLRAHSSARGVQSVLRYRVESRASVAPTPFIFSRSCGFNGTRPRNGSANATRPPLAGEDSRNGSLRAIRPAKSAPR